MKGRHLVTIVLALLTLSAATLLLPRFMPTQGCLESANVIDINVNGTLMGSLCFGAMQMPVVRSIRTGHGVAVTRSLSSLESAKASGLDHPHHMSFWFSHGEVNGRNFWSESGNRIVVNSYDLSSKRDSFSCAMICDWETGAGLSLIRERRELCVQVDKGLSFFDFRSVLKATVGKVVFGDTKEGGISIRFDDTLRVSEIRNSDGLDGEQNVWGTSSHWVKVLAEAPGKSVGVLAVVPISQIEQNHWHVRQYGLLAANFHGRQAFGAGVQKREERLSFGETSEYAVRFVFFEGDLSDTMCDEIALEYDEGT